MTTMEALETTAHTLRRMESLLTASNEYDLYRSVRLTRLEVENMVAQEQETPGRYEALAD